jgi:hypothetical protein
MPLTLSYIASIAPRAKNNPQIARELHKFREWEPYFLKDRFSTSPPIVLEVDGTRLPPLPIEDVIRNHVKPGLLLSLETNCFAVKKQELFRWKDLRTQLERDAGPTPIVYTLKSLEGKGGHKAQGGQVRQAHFALSAQQDFPDLMDIPYRTLIHGGHAEVTLRHDTKRSEVPREEYIQGWDWLLWRFPHLRPDVILKSMPQDTFFYIDPWTSGNKIAWVFARREEVLSKRVIDANKRMRSVKGLVLRELGKS